MIVIKKTYFLDVTGIHILKFCLLRKIIDEKMKKLSNKYISKKSIHPYL